MLYAEEAGETAPLPGAAASGAVAGAGLVGVVLLALELRDRREEFDVDREVRESLLATEDIEDDRAEAREAVDPPELSRFRAVSLLTWSLLMLAAFCP